MAIYHLHVKVISRKAGQSAVASAAYRSASRLRDNRLDRDQDFSNKRGVVHSEVLLPDHAPDVWEDRERLWNDVEAFEVRRKLKEKGPVTIPREFVFMDRAAIGLGAAYLRLGAELNYHQLFEESLEGFDEAALAKRQQEALSKTGLSD